MIDEVNKWCCGDHQNDEVETICLYNDKSPFQSFWSDLVTRHTFPLLSHVARKLSVAVTSEAACERIFSSVGFVHSDLRSRLKPELVEAETAIRCRVKQPVDVTNCDVSNSSTISEEQPASIDNCRFEDFISHDMLSTNELLLVESLFDAGDLCGRIQNKTNRYRVVHRNTRYFGKQKNHYLQQGLLSPIRAPRLHRFPTRISQKVDL